MTRSARHRSTGGAAPTAAPLGRLALLLISLLALVAACSRGPDVTDVTVTVGETAVVLPAALTCITPTGATELACAGGDNDDEAPHLAVAPGTPLTISVPRSVGDTPWVVVFSYTDAAGQPQGDRTAVFSPEQHYTYQLTPPDGAQLHRLEVQSLTAAPGNDGGIEFPVVGSWVLLVDSPDGETTP